MYFYNVYTHTHTHIKEVCKKIMEMQIIKYYSKSQNFLNLNEHIF